MPQTKSTESQITALEIKMANMINQNASTKSLFAINGKINKLKNQLKEKKKFDWLAQ